MDAGGLVARSIALPRRFGIVWRGGVCVWVVGVEEVAEAGDRFFYAGACLAAQSFREAYACMHYNATQGLFVHDSGWIAERAADCGEVFEGDEGGAWRSIGLDGADVLGEGTAE